MQRPSTGDLLAGLRKGLAETVLPTLAKGPAQAQLKAALHLIGRLERSWDLAHFHLAMDNADIESVLSDQMPETTATDVPTGYNDPALRALATRNFALHAALEVEPPTEAIEALYRRMAARDSAFIGDRP